jgi:hypothetical protein
MSEFLRNESAEPHTSSYPPDHLSCLYQKIGISAVAAALVVMADPIGPKEVRDLDESRTPVLFRQLAQTSSLFE